ncbi:MAG: protein kinase [Armatimonas sp.]
MSQPPSPLLLDVLQYARIVESREVLSAEPISARRGAEVWKVALRDNRVLRAKLAVRTGDSVAPSTESLHREYTVLSELESLTCVFQPQFGVLPRTEEPVSFLFTDWVDGRPATEPLKAAHSGRLSVDEGTNTVRALFACLGALHSAGWVHGDLQPAHLLCQENGEILLIDFGLAQSTQRPMENFRGGLVHFNAPEICSAMLADRLAQATPQSDVFSLASVVFHALTGKVIGDYSQEQEWEEILTCLAEGKLRTAELATALENNPALCAVLMQCLALEPAERPADANAVLSLLPEL